MIKWTMRRDIEVLVAQRSNIPNCIKDVPKVPKSDPRWGTTSNHFLRVLKGINGP